IAAFKVQRGYFASLRSHYEDGGWSAVRARRCSVEGRAHDLTQDVEDPVDQYIDSPRIDVAAAGLKQHRPLPCCLSMESKSGVPIINCPRRKSSAIKSPPCVLVAVVSEPR